MKEKTIQTTVYEASDGREYLTKEECLKHEEYLKKIANIKYYRVSCRPDLTETGYFTEHFFVAVTRQRYLHQEDITTAWAIDKFGYIGQSVQGCGLQRYFSIGEISKDDYFNSKTGNRFLFSEEDIEGFPKHFDELQVLTKKYGRR